jgi:hypothetical protein
MGTQASAEQRLREPDIVLPPPPTPFGAYVEAVKIGNLLFLSGRSSATNRNMSDASVARWWRRTGTRRRRPLDSAPIELVFEIAA